jgi:hypothetical protein
LPGTSHSVRILRLARVGSIVTDIENSYTVSVQGRTPSEIFQNQATKEQVVNLIIEFWDTWLTARVRYSLDKDDLIIAWDEMNMPLEVHSKWIYVVGKHL